MFFRPSLLSYVSGKLRGTLGDHKILTGMGVIPYFNFRGNPNLLFCRYPLGLQVVSTLLVASDSGDGGGGRVLLPDWRLHHVFGDR